MDAKTILFAVIVVCVVIALVVAVKNGKEGFLPAIAYNPLFIDPLGSSRYTSKGYTSGVMPSIDAGPDGGWLCPGLLGVPP